MHVLLLLLMMILVLQLLLLLLMLQLLLLKLLMLLLLMLLILMMLLVDATIVAVVASFADYIIVVANDVADAMRFVAAAFSPVMGVASYVVVATVVAAIVVDGVA